MLASQDLKKRTNRNKLFAALAVILVVSSVFVALVVVYIGNSASGITRVACVGDSITAGLGYPDELWRLLGNDYLVENFGVGGSTALLSSDNPYMNRTAFELAKAFLPDVVVIMLGTNDANPAYYGHIDEFVSDYEALVNGFQALAGKPKIWIVLPPPIFNSGSGPNGTDLAEGVIPRIKLVADELNLPTIDVYSALSGHPEDFIYDGIHPNSQGVKVIAMEVFQAISAGTHS